MSDFCQGQDPLSYAMCCNFQEYQSIHSTIYRTTIWSHIVLPSPTKRFRQVIDGFEIQSSLQLDLIYSGHSVLLILTVSIFCRPEQVSAYIYDKASRLMFHQFSPLIISLRSVILMFFRNCHPNCVRGQRQRCSCSKRAGYNIQASYFYRSTQSWVL